MAGALLEDKGSRLKKKIQEAQRHDQSVIAHTHIHTPCHPDSVGHRLVTMKRNTPEQLRPRNQNCPKHHKSLSRPHCVPFPSFMLVAQFKNKSRRHQALTGVLTTPTTSELSFPKQSLVPVPA